MPGAQRVKLLTRHKATRIESAFHALTDHIVDLLARTTKGSRGPVRHFGNITDEIRPTHLAVPVFLRCRPLLGDCKRLARCTTSLSVTLYTLI
jgi:hypothetical protein